MSILDPLEIEFKQKQMRKCRRPVLIAWIWIGFIVGIYAYGWFYLFFSKYPEPYRTKLMYNYFICSSAYLVLMALSRYQRFITLLLATMLLAGSIILYFPGFRGVLAQSVLMLDLISVLICSRGVLYAWEYESLKKELSRYDEPPRDSVA